MNILLRSVCLAFIESGDSQIWNRDVEFPAQTFVNIVAPSGKGKTSLLSLLYGLIRRYSGSLRFDRREASGLGRAHWACLRQSHLSLVFQDLRLFSGLTCLDNVMLNAEQTGPADPDRIAEAFRRLGVEALRDTPAATCSQGERQRIAFIRAIVQPFDWILLDEPFSHLDEVRVHAMRDLLLEACHLNNAGLILASLQASDLLPFHRTYTL